MEDKSKESEIIKKMLRIERGVPRADSEGYDPMFGIPLSTITWKYKGVFHRDFGPAIETSHGYKCWYQFGKKHREDGPAEITAYGEHSYYINGNRLTEEEFYLRTKRD